MMKPNLDFLLRILACLLVGFVCSGRAEEYYVATNGNNASDGSLATPWLTVQHAATNVNAGDTVYVRDGVYNERVVLGRSGSADGGYITISSYPGEAPAIDGAGLTAGDADGLITFNSQDYIILDGLEIRNFITSTRWKVPMGVYINGDSSFVRLRNLKIHDIESNYDSGKDYVEGADAHGIGVYGDHASIPITSLLIKGVEIYNCELGSSEAMVINGNVDGFEVADCTVHDNDNIGIDFIGHEGTCSTPSLDQARNGVCTDNLIFNIATSGNQAYRDGGGYDRSAGGIYVDGGKQIVIERNTIHDCDIGLEVASEWNGKYTSYITVRNNLIRNNYIGGIYCGGYASDKGSAQYCKFIGNTLYHNDTSDSYSGEITLQWHVMDCEFANNLMVAQRNDGADAVYVGGAGGRGSAPVNTSFDYNAYYTDVSVNGPSFRWGNNEGYTWAWWRGNGHETNGMHNTDPLLVNPSLNDFHLQTNSPAIDQGTHEGDIGALDIDDQIRIVRSAVDIGADEVQFYTTQGTPYWWLDAYKLVTNGYENADGSDADGDEAYAWQEYRADTNPTNASSIFRILAISGSSSRTVHFDSSTNRLYTLYSSSSLTDTAWIAVPGQGPRAGVGVSDFMLDTNDVPRKFYKLSAELK